MQVLQVEDDTDTAIAVELMLRAKGYDCDTTGLGVNAVDLATQSEYDLILLDINLPDIDGYEVLRRLEAAQVRTPVVIQSGLVRRDEFEKGLGFGVEDFLLKPFSSEELADRIKAAFGHHDNSGVDSGEKFTRWNAQARQDSNRRRHPRIKTLKSGEIIYHNDVCRTDCLLLNLSDGGAALQPVDYMDLPEFFELRLRNGQSHQCQICWRHGDKVGVRFLPATT